jgi:transcriptional regulator with XRE-family HTH domain
MEAFAELLGLSKNYVGNVERGEYEISLSTLARVAKILGLKMSELLAEAGL